MIRKVIMLINVRFSMLAKDWVSVGVLLKFDSLLIVVFLVGIYKQLFWDNCFYDYFPG